MADRNRITNQPADSEAALRAQVANAEGVVVPGNEKTEVGNYFVANYPPFSFWQAEQVAEVERLLKAPADPELPLGLYHHVPFCRRRCHFCYFRVYTEKSAEEIKAYLDATIRELAFYAAQPYVKGRKLDCVYFGGGTPSYLSPSQLIDLTDRMKDLMPWDSTREVAFECEPGTLNAKKVEAIKKIGVTRLSLGIESFDDEILELNGRAHKGAEVDRAYTAARAAGFDQINIDLIAGMMGETEENWFRSVDRAIELDSEMVTIYQMEIPYNTGIYREMKSAGKTVAPVADWATKRHWVDKAYERFEAAGYTVTSAYTVVKNPAQSKFVYRDNLFGGADLLPLGVASFGHLGGIHIQNENNMPDYIDQVTREGGHHSLSRAYVTDPEERFVREFLLRMKLGEGDPVYYRKKYGIDPLQFYGKQLSDLQRDGYAVLDGGEITITRNGLLQIDRLLHAFFLERHQGARYV